MNTEDLIQHYTYLQSEIIDTIEKEPVKSVDNDKFKEIKKVKIHKFAHKEKIKCGKKCLIKKETYRKDHKVINFF